MLSIKTEGNGINFMVKLGYTVSFCEIRAFIVFNFLLTSPSTCTLTCLPLFILKAMHTHCISYTTWTHDIGSCIYSRYVKQSNFKAIHSKRLQRSEQKSLTICNWPLMQNYRPTSVNTFSNSSSLASLWGDFLIYHHTWLSRTRLQMIK